jgi:hypothetical protein
MDNARQKRLKARGLVIPDSAGQDAVRVYLQYRSNVAGGSRAARRETLRKHFERVASEHSGSRLELDPASLSVSGQMIEALVPLEDYEQVVRDLAGDDLHIDLVQSFKAT